MADLPEARVCHLTTGRLRLRVPEKRRDNAFFRTVEQRLAGWDNVDRVEVNPLTASVLSPSPTRLRCLPKTRCAMTFSR